VKNGVNDEIRQSTEEFVRLHVAMGFEGIDAIHGAALDYFEDEDEFDVLEPYLGQLTRALVGEHCRAQKLWPVETDCDRLDFGFLMLEEERGIVARQHFTCCSTDGHNDIWAEIHQKQQCGPVAGYIFYHEQDTENAVRRGKLYLAFGAVQEGDDAACEIARCAVEVLQDVHLDVTWSGSPRERILAKLDWKKRREDC
jgi:hypothetical protein